MLPEIEPPRYAVNARTIAQYLVAKRKFHKWRLRTANDKIQAIEAILSNPEDAPEWDDLNDDAYYHQRCLDDIEKERSYLAEASTGR